MVNPSKRTWAVYAVVIALVALAAWFIVMKPIEPAKVATPRVAITLPGTLGVGTAPRSSGKPFPQLSCRAGVPRKLIIPSLDVSAPFERIGLDEKAPADSEGRHPLGNPKDRTKAGWYADGPRPGSGRGTILTNGHTYRNNSAIFKEDFASKVAVGQLIYVETASGSTCIYRISRVWREVSSAHDYPRIVSSQDLYDFNGPERLFLATCGGSWNSVAQDYNDITLLIATPINRT